MQINKEISNELNENDFENFREDSFIFNGKLFKKYDKSTNYKPKNKIKRIIYKCSFNRKNENFKEKMKMSSFCNVTIEYIFPGQNVKSGYFLKKGHSNVTNTIILLYLQSN